MRFLASGCSYTAYDWTTWADIVGCYFEEYKNVGAGGQDNASIARSIIDHAQDGDTVVVLWSGYDRWSTYSDEKQLLLPQRELSDNYWQHHGCITTLGKEFFVNFYHRLERFKTSMDYVQLVDLHSQQNNYQVYHFSAFPWFLGEIEKNIDQRLVDIFSKYNIKNNYLLDKSMEEFVLETNQQTPVRHKYAPTGEDIHPLPVAQYQFVKQFIAPKLKLTLTEDVYSSIIKEQENIVLHGKLKNET